MDKDTQIPFFESVIKVLQFQFLVLQTADYEPSSIIFKPVNIKLAT